MDDEMFVYSKLKCKICGYEAVDLSSHIKNKHKISVSEYKDKFNVIRVVSEDYAKRKSNNTAKTRHKLGNFKSWNEGKTKHTDKRLAKIGRSISSAVTTKESIEKRKNTILKKYGVEHTLQSKEIRLKSEKTLLKKYGAKNYAMSFEFRKKFILRRIHRLKDVVLLDEVKDYETFVKFKCVTCGHLFKKKLNQNIYCPTCYNKWKSLAENDVKRYVESLGFLTVSNTRDLISKKGVSKFYKKVPREIDIYVPDKNFGIEYNGIKWHSSQYLVDDYHKFKTEECEKKGVQLIHIFENEWIFKQDIIKSILSSKLGVCKNKIMARKCEIREVGFFEKKEFLHHNHIQGDVVSKVNIGLFFDNKLISLMTFGKKRNSISGKNEDGVYELLRFCNDLDTTVIGGASKLFKHFIKKWSPKKVISYADRRFSMGRLYENLGFTFEYDTKPNYFYVFQNQLHSRLGFQKHKLKTHELTKNVFDDKLTESEILEKVGVYRIFDSGNKKYVFSPKN